MAPLLWIIVRTVVVEGVVAEALVGFLVQDHAWLWVVLCVHVYALVLLLGLCASFATHRHEVTAEGLRVRDGIFNEVVVPWAAITSVRCSKKSNLGRPGLKVDGDAMTVALGDATVVLGLDRGRPLIVNGRLAGPRPAWPWITADASERLVAAVQVRREAAGHPASGRGRPWVP